MSDAGEYSSTSSYEDEDTEVRITRATSDTDRFNILLSKIEGLAKGQKKMRKKLKKLDSIETQLKSLRNDHEAVAARVTTVEADVTALKAKVDEFDKIKEDYKNAIKKTQISQVASKFSSMRFNIIVRNHKQDESNAWENKDESVRIVRDILKNVLKIPRSDTIGIADAHRLNASKGRRPLIFKLQTLVDKKKIWDYIGNIKTFNDEQPDGEKLKIDMIHLPEKLACDKSDLWTNYWEAKNKGLRPKWWFDITEGQYCYKIDKKIHRPAHDNFQPKQTMIVSSPAAQFV